MFHQVLPTISVAVSPFGANASGVQWSRGLVVQRYSGVEVDWYSGTGVQRYRGTVVQRYYSAPASRCRCECFICVHFLNRDIVETNDNMSTHKNNPINPQI
jgi:hypothetical protein